MRFNRYSIRSALKRTAQAWRLARGRLTREDARDLHYEIEELAGWHTLASIDDDRVLEDIRELGCDDPRAEEWAERAASRVASKWSDDSDYVQGALDWAHDLVREYAADDGVNLYAEPAEPEAADAGADQ